MILEMSRSTTANASWIMRKPELLGTEFKITCYPVTGAMTRIETQRGKYFFLVF